MPGGKTSNWLLLALIYGFIFEGLSWWPSPAAGPCLINPQEHAQSGQNDNRQACPTFFRGSLILLSRGDHFVERHDKSIVAVFTVVLAVSTILLWRSTDKLWRADERQMKLIEANAAQQSSDMQASVEVARIAAESARKAADVAEHGLITAQRPFVVPGPLTWRPVSDAKGGIVWQFYGAWENRGNTPTKNFKSYFVKAFGIRISDVGDPFGGNLGMTEEDKRRSTPNYIAPMGNIGMGPVSVAGADLAAVQKREAPLAFGGVATYESNLPGDRPHITKFCRFVTEIEGNPLMADHNLVIGFSSCRTNNCVDDDCE